MGNLKGGKTMTRFLGLITFSFVMIGGFYAQQVFSQTCTLAGTWTQDSEGLGQSTWEITADGEAIESGLGNAKGRATLAGGKLRIDWTIAGYNNSGYYEWTLDPSCRTGSGIAVNTVSGVTLKTTVTK